MNERTQKIYKQLLNDYHALYCMETEILQAYEMLRGCYAGKNKVLICGNGGSAADCEHIVGELMKGFMLPRTVEGVAVNRLQGTLRAISLVSQTALISAIANDIGADMIFAQQVYGYMDNGDVLIALSTSGNAANVVKAAETALMLGGKVLAITGKSGGTLKNVSTLSLCFPFDETYKIQEYTLPVYHALCAMLESEFF